MFTRYPIPTLLLFGSLGPLGGALFSQYVLGYPPCPLCMWQRWPYLLPLLAGLIEVFYLRGASRRPAPPSLRGKALGFPRVPSNVLLGIGMLGWLATASIAAYHVGIEHGWIVQESGCSASALSGNVSDIRAQIMNAPLVACNVVDLRILGLSMANWNLAAGFALAFMGWKLYRRKGKI